MSAEENLLARQLEAVSLQLASLPSQWRSDLREFEGRIGAQVAEILKDIKGFEEKQLIVIQEQARQDERIKAQEKKISDLDQAVDQCFSKARAIERDLGGKVNGINLKLAYWTGGGAVIGFVATKVAGKWGF